MTDSVVKDLIARSQCGHPEAAGALYSRYHQSIYRYLYYRTGDLKVAEDLTSDVFLKMVQALPTYRIEATPFHAWLFQVARNLVIDHYRRASAHPVVAIDENLDSDGRDLDSMVDFHLNSADLAQAFSRLDDSQRDVLLLRFIEEMPIAEVAGTLHKSVDSIKALQRRGLITLRKMLNHKENGHE